ncbi:RHS repeat-associated core domain-containing protein, partial [Longimicrobium sp.]|uniref:RHS repeat-associated core domain-containing protein n=1 Tax=Longimicrobium sp. TaxID=2029185 RepID=UPI002E31983A
MPGGNNMTSGASDLESTSAGGDFCGRVSYFHAGGSDKPLLITKEGAESVVPRDTWRGQFHAGTSATTGLVRDCQQGGQTGCLLIAWPGWNTSASHAWGEGGPDIVGWYGGLVDGMRDASGQMYMRNRYYDPATGQFTQTHPIGLAGGMNAYGFAAGDPVSYADPYGLYVCAQTRAMRLEIERAYHMQINWDADGCVRNPSNTNALSGSGQYAQLQSEFDATVTSSIRFDVRSVRFGRRGSQIIRRSSGHCEIVIARYQHQESWSWDLFNPDRRRYGMM